MKKRNLISVLFLTVLLVLPAISYSSPNIIIDGAMSNTEWGSYQAKDFNYGDYLGPGYGGQNFDVERIGIYVDDTYMYIGLQTGFELNHREPDGIDNVRPGHIAVGFTAYDTTPDPYTSLTPSDYQFAFQFDFSNGWSNPDLIARKVDSWHTVDYPDGVYAPYPYVPDNASLLADGGSVVDVDYQRYGGTMYDPYRNTLEAKIKLSSLKAELLGFNFDAGFNANVFWTMSCNNDMLGKAFSVDPTPSGNAVPEPATILLFGIGLLGASALGRKKINLN